MQPQTTFQHNFGFQKNFYSDIKVILGTYLICEAPITEDTKHNTDFSVFNLQNVRVACRIRRKDKYAKYGDEFTIRYKTFYGKETELDKIIMGWGDYLLYGFGDDVNRKIIAWKLGDLKVFRKEINQQLVRNSGKYDASYMKNIGSDSEFLAFKWNKFPSVFVVAEDPVSSALNVNNIDVYDYMEHYNKEQPKELL